MKFCPKCHSTFERPEADRCDECGWIKRKEASKRQGGIERCAWVTPSGERCAYPGTIWRDVHGTGPGMCRFHVQEDCTRDFGELVVKQSLAGIVPKRPEYHACQARARKGCVIHAMPGRDLCRVCARAEDVGEVVRRIMGAEPKEVMVGGAALIANSVIAEEPPMPELPDWTEAPAPDDELEVM